MHSFPIGMTGYSPFSLNFSAATFGSTPTITCYSSNAKVPGLNNAITYYLNRQWSIEPSDISAYTYSVDIQYLDLDIIGTGTENDLKPVKKSGVSFYKPSGCLFTSGIEQGTSTINSGTNTLTWSGLTTFSIFGGAGDGGAALPITLLHFKVKQDGKSVKIDWATASEKNNALFTVERSQNGIHFETVLSKKGAGNSMSTLYYAGFDQKPYTGTSYYRLKQTDFDGKSEYSELASVTFEQEIQALTLRVYPNPAVDGIFNVRIDSEEKERYELVVLNSIGQKIYSTTWDVQNGINDLNVNLENHPEGIYFIEVSNERIGKLVKEVKL